MGVKETFKGYEDSGAGYDFLKEAVAGYYKSFGVDIPADDIRINDGAKSDCGNIVDIFGDDNVVLITDPAYPVYVDTNLMNGRKVIYADSNEENNFAAMPDENVKCDIIYLCSPNNPTGSVYTKEQLKVWIDYAKKNNAIIITILHMRHSLQKRTYQEAFLLLRVQRNVLSRCAHFQRQQASQE